MLEKTEDLELKHEEELASMRQSYESEIDQFNSKVLGLETSLKNISESQE